MAVNVHRLAPIALLCLSLNSATAAPKSAAPAGLFPDDTRLEHTVTVQRGRVYLGELLESLSEQSGVVLRVDDGQGPASGIDLTVFLKDRPLREVILALPELLSIRGDQWKWQKPKAGDYLLMHQQSLSAASAANRKAVVDAFSKDVRDFYRVAKMPDDQRTQAAAAYPRLFPGGQIRSGQLDLFRQLGDAEVERVISGLPAPATGDKLSPRGRSALEFGLEGQDPSVRSGGVTFHITWEPPMIGPVLWATNKSGISGNLVGGPLWDAAWFPGQADGWRDRNDPDAQAFYINQLKGVGGKPLPDNTMAAWLKKAAKLQELNVIADPIAPRAGRHTSTAWLGSTPEQTILAIQFHEQMTARKCGAIHLLRHATAALSPRLHLVPWAQIKALRSAAEQGEGFLPLADLSRLASLTDWQLGGLREEFPVCDKGLIGPWREILSFSGLLDGRARGLLEAPAGIPLSETGLSARNVLLAGSDAQHVRGLDLIARDPAHVRLRMLRQPHKVSVRSRVGSREVDVIDAVWEVDLPGTPVHRQILQQRPRVPLEPE